MKKFVLLLFIPIFTSSISYSQFVQQNPSFPVAFDSTFHRTSSGWGAPVIADINKDGTKEIITVTDFEGGDPFNLFVLGTNGQPLQGFPKTFSGLKSLAVGDVDGDGFLDIAMRCCYSSSNKVDVIDYRGTSLSGFPKNLIYSATALIWPITLYDLDGNGKLEVICGEPDNIHVFNYNGDERTGWPRRVPGNASDQPAVGDLDHDGNAEIIYSSYKPGSYLDSGMVHVFKQDGTYFPGWPKLLDSNYFCGAPTIYINASNSSLNFICLPLTQYGLRSGSKKILKVSTSGAILNSAMVNVYDFLDNVAMGDLNGDGQLEFVTADQYSYDPGLHVFSSSFTLLTGWPQYGSNVIIPLTLGKVIPGNRIQIVSGVQQADQLAGYLFVYEMDGSQPSWSPLRPTGLTTGLSFNDLEGDGNADVVLITIQNKAYMNVFKIPGVQFNLQNFPWPMANHDRYRSNQYGFVPPDEPIGLKPISEKIPFAFKLYQNYPNPFNPVTTIEFDLSRRSFARILIYDVLGREIKSLISEYLSAGKYKMEWNASSYSSGVYFCKFVIDTSPEDASLNKSFTEIKKMVLVK